ncbi:MAG: hypothetical protein LQ349_005158 [Xanthoria aureola]|nr:MAG: hypothetical protein LQ349_005158 [Xanthoria aureola]
MKCLLAVGACYLDTILDVDHYPAEDEKLRASSILTRRGGNCPNTLDILQQLLDTDAGIPTVSLALLAVLPSSSSPAYQEIRSSFNVSTDLAHCICRQQINEPASSYIIRSRVMDSRTIINYNGLPEMTAAEFTAVADKLGEENMAWCHFEVRERKSARFCYDMYPNFFLLDLTLTMEFCCGKGRIPDVTLQCLQHLRHHLPTVTISVEVEKPGREGLQDLAALADVVFYSKSWARVCIPKSHKAYFTFITNFVVMKGNGYESSEECLRSQAPLASKASLLLCTWGDAGVGALELPTLRYRECPAFRTAGTDTVDTVGAGDTFIAGMLFALTCRAEWDLDRKLRFANEVAGRKVVQEGFRGLGGCMRHAL